MRKSTLIGISILSVFILCSLSYQPIVADRQIDNIPIVDDIKTSDVDIDELKEFCSRIIKSRFQSDDDCDCDSNVWRPNLICLIMDIIAFPLAFLVFFIIEPLGLDNLYDIFIIPILILQDIYSALGCD